MRHYIRYISQSVFTLTLFIASVLTIIVWLSQSLRYHNLIANSKLDLLTFFELSALIIPSLAFIIIPISLFIAILYLYYKLINDSELVILQMAGLNRLDLSKPVLIVALFCTIVSYVLSLYLVPFSYRVFKEKITFYKNNATYALLEEGVFNNSIKNVTFYVEEHKPDGTLKTILIHDARNADNPRTVIAETGRIIRAADSTRLDLNNGHQHYLNKEGQLAILYFDHLSYYPIVESPNNSQPRILDPQERYLPELLSPKEPAVNKAKLNAELNQRLIWPLYNIILALLAVLTLLTSKYSRRGQVKRIAICAVLSVVMVTLFLLLNHLNTQVIWTQMLVYLYVMGLLLTQIKLLFHE